MFAKDFHKIFSSSRKHKLPTKIFVFELSRPRSPLRKEAFNLFNFLLERQLARSVYNEIFPWHRNDANRSFKVFCVIYKLSKFQHWNGSGTKLLAYKLVACHYSESTQRLVFLFIVSPANREAFVIPSSTILIKISVGAERCSIKWSFAMSNFNFANRIQKGFGVELLACFTEILNVQTNSHQLRFRWINKAKCFMFSVLHKLGWSVHSSNKMQITGVRRVLE